MLPKISCLKKKKKKKSKKQKEQKSKSAWKLSPNSFQSTERKTQQETSLFFLKIYKDLNKNASFFTLLSYLCSSRGNVFTI